jgi:mono/diheme cytochrome c family protein
MDQAGVGRIYDPPDIKPPLPQIALMSGAAQGPSYAAWLVSICSRVAIVSIALWIVTAGNHAAAADARRGEIFAQRWCSQCHGIRPNQGSPKNNVPSFSDLARHPSIGENWLRAALRTTPHGAMPKFKLRRQDLDDTVSYILSLRPQ